MRQRRNPVHRASAGNQARALATFALGLTRQDEYGSVAASKTQLVDRMANLILEDLLRRGAEVVTAERPVVAMLVSVVRVT
jgi:hypothetical protein